VKIGMDAYKRGFATSAHPGGRPIRPQTCEFLLLGRSSLRDLSSRAQHAPVLVTPHVGNRRTLSSRGVSPAATYRRGPRRGGIFIREAA
jgi:hypothetical protein